MKKILLSLLLITISLYASTRAASQNCKESVLPFLPPFEGYSLTDYCKMSESFYHDFAVARNSRSVHREGIYRETWYKRNPDNSRHISGPQILKQQTDAIKAAGGELVPDSDGDVFKIAYQGKEYWILVNANIYSEDQDNYGVISIEGGATKQESGSEGITGSIGTTLQQVPQAAGTGTYHGHTIGEHYGGGIVFYVYDNGQHGLIAAISDQIAAVRWNTNTTTRTNANADGVSAGKSNTAIIIASQTQATTYAAKICNEYSATDSEGVRYGDWYLPSKHELNLLYLQKTVLVGFEDTYYWSSNEWNEGNDTELSVIRAWTQNFLNGNFETSAKSNTYRVRSIRSF